MKVRNVLLVAAVLPAAAGAHAADLPGAEPVEYAKVCSSYDEGFFYIPGTDTCLQISGKVRADYVLRDDDPELIGAYTFPLDESADDFTSDVRGVFALDARSETDWGTLRAYLEFEGRSRSGAYSNGLGGTESEFSFCFQTPKGLAFSLFRPSCSSAASRRVTHLHSLTSSNTTR